jgi:hypothetical protein
MEEPIFDDDVHRLIILSSSVLEFPKLSLINKYFNVVCHDKNTWSIIFKEKDLVILDDNITTMKKYIEEYQKISYAAYTAKGFYEMMQLSYKGAKEINMFGMTFCVNNLIVTSKILSQDILNKVPHNRFNINIVIGDDSYKIIYSENMVGLIFEDNFPDIDAITNNYNDKNVLISLLTTILYYYPDKCIVDCYCRRLRPVMKNGNLIDKRTEYWKHYYSHYHNIYF